VSAPDRMLPDPHADGRDLLTAIGVPDADAWTVADDRWSVGAHRRLPHGTSCEVRRRREGGLCRLVIDRISKTRSRLAVPKPDQLLGPYIKAKGEDADAGQA